MIVPEDELPPLSEVERMARREPPAQFTQPEHKLYAHRPPSALLVMVCRARDLIMCDYNWLTRTGSSDPTVKLQVEGRDEVEQTSTQYKTLTPEWDEDFLLPCDDPEETLRVTVEDYDRFSGHSDRVERPRAPRRIPLAALKHRQLMVNTYRLTDAKGRTKKNRGTIDLQLRWVHSPEHAVVIDHKYDEKEAFPGREANAVRILLIRGRKLPAMDRRLFGKEGTSDPMVTFRLKDKQLESTVKNKQLSPEWLESFELRADDPDDSIVEVIVDDWDQLSGNDCMGKCFIDVKELKNRKLHRRWYALLPPSSKKPDQAAVDDESVSEYSSEGEYGAEFLDHANKAPLGKLELACRWLYLPDFDLPVPDQMLRDTYPHDKINALHIYLVRGTHLPAVDVDVMGHRTSDPLVTFVLEEERKNSKVKKRTLEPFWKEYFDVSVEGDLEPQVLKIVCDDWDLVGGNDFMGQCAVPLTKLLDRQLHRDWFWLMGEDNEDDRSRGKLDIALRLYHNPEYVFATPERLLDTTNRADRAANCLLVHIIRARGLPVMDPSILGAGGSADPMIRLHLSGEREKTLIKRKTLAPVWEETFALKCDFPSEVLELTLWDFDVTSANDEIGAVYVPVASLQDRQLHRAWYPVGPVASEDGLVDNLEPISRHALKCGELVVSSGSVVDAHVSAIVNAANEGCLGGGGVDGAITRAGGELLAEKRLALPVHHNKRCSSGDAVITSGGPFSDLKCDCVIHAVGPDYRRLPPATENEDDDLARGDSILRNAYTAAMKRAKEQKCKTIAFSLLSAGIFRGRQSLDNVLRVAVEAIGDATYPGLQRVHLVAFSTKEQEALQRVIEYPEIKRGRLELALRWRYDKNFYWEEPEHMLVPEKFPDLPPNRLDIFVSRGKHLPIMDWDRNSPSGGSSDAVCTLTIEGDQRHTSVKLTTLNPTWAEAFDFDAFAGETLRIQVDDWDEDGSLDRIGEVHIPLASLASRKSERRWYAIQHDGPLSEGQLTRGWVEVAGRWSHDPERACDLPGELGEDKPRYSLRPNKLLFYLIRARGLMAADPGNDQQRPTSDPAAILTIPYHPQSNWESAARWTTLVPTWCELFEFEQLDDLGFPLTLTVVDKDEGVDDDDDVLGEVSFDLEKLADRKTVRGWYPLLPRIDADRYWTRRWQAEREDQSPRAGELCLARAIQTFVPEGSADDASFLKEMSLEEHATVVVLKDELIGEGWIFALRENDAGYVPRHYLTPQDYLGKVEVALRWVHDPLQVEPLPYTFLHPKDIDKPVNALRVRIFKCRSSIKAPSTLRCDVWLDRHGEVAHKHATKSATRVEGTRFTTWADDFLLPLDESDPSAIIFNVRGAQPKVYEESSEEDEYEDLQSVEEEEDVGESVGRLEIPYEKLKRCIVRDWYDLESDDAAKVQALKDAKASMSVEAYKVFSKDLLQVQELEVACLLVHDSRVEYESDFRKHVASLQKQEDTERGYTLEDQTQKEDRFYLRFKFQAGNRIRGEFDSYAPLCSRCLLKDKSVFSQPLNHYDPSIKKQDPSVILTKPESEWYVYEVPSHVTLARKFHAHHVERNLKENMMTFARKCFNSGYRIEGSSTVEADEAHLMTAIEFKQDFALYLDASREFFDEWADDVFDVYTKTYEGPFEVDGVHYDPSANPPDEDVPHVVKGGWVSGFGEERKAWARIEAGQRERTWREANPHADANEMFARYEEKFRRWNIEEENDPDCIDRRAQAAEAKRKEEMMKGM